MLAKEYPRAAIAIIAACVVVVLGIFALNNHQANLLQESQRNKTAAHWASAGLQNPITTLKDGGDKRTVGRAGSCTVTIEGFTTFTSLVIASNIGNPTVRQEFVFQSGEQTNADEVAFDYIGRLQEIAPFCMVG